MRASLFVAPLPAEPQPRLPTPNPQLLPPTPSCPRYESFYHIDFPIPLALHATAVFVSVTMAYVQADTQRQAFLAKLLQVRCLMPTAPAYRTCLPAHCPLPTAYLPTAYHSLHPLQVHFREQRIEQLAQEKERLQYERQRRPVSLPPQSPGPSDSYVSRPATEGGDEATDCFRLPSTAAAGGGETKGRATRHRRRPRGGGVGVAADGSERASEEGSEATSAASERTDATPAGHIRCYNAACAKAKRFGGSSASSATTCNSGSSAFPTTPALEDLRNGERPACYPKTHARELSTGSLYELAKRGAKSRPLPFLPGSKARPSTPAPPDCPPDGIFGKHLARDSGPDGLDASCCAVEVLVATNSPRSENQMVRPRPLLCCSPCALSTPCSPNLTTTRACCAACWSLLS